MRKKPDITEFTTPKDPTAFLEGGIADAAEGAKKSDRLLSKTAQAEEVKRHGRGRVQKIFHFPEELAERLREEAFTQSRKMGTRVTEKDIVIEALNAYFNYK